MVSGSQCRGLVGCQWSAEFPNDPIIVTNLRRIRISLNKNKLKVFSSRQKRRTSLWKSLAEGGYYNSKYNMLLTTKLQLIKTWFGQDFGVFVNRGFGLGLDNFRFLWSVNHLGNQRNRELNFSMPNPLWEYKRVIFTDLELSVPGANILRTNLILGSTNRMLRWTERLLDTSKTNNIRIWKSHLFFQVIHRAK